MSVTGMYRNDCMLRQIAEGVSQDNAPEGTLINTKKEWNYIQGLSLMMVKRTNMGPTEVSFALERAKTNVFASFASGIAPILTRSIGEY